MKQEESEAAGGLAHGSQRRARQEFLSEELEFLRVLWLVDHSMQRTSHRMQNVIGVTGPQRLVLRTISSLPSVGPAEVADILHLHPSTLTGIFKRLNARRLIERRRDRTDGRRARLYITSRGQRLIRSEEGTLEHSVKHTLSRWSRKQVRLVQDVLTDLAHTLDERVIQKQVPQTRARSRG